jgi:tetratricopeptide (TPR) repeat protein
MSIAHSSPTAPLVAATLPLLMQQIFSGRADQLTEAEAEITRLLAAHGDDPDLLHACGLIHQQRGEWSQAREWLERAVALLPQHPAYRCNLGATLRKLGEVDAAIAQYQEAIRLKPDMADAHFNLGNAYREQEHHREAATAYQAALAIKPDYLGAHNNLGLSLGALEDWQAASQHLLIALQHRPELLETRVMLASALRELGSTERSREQCHLALRYDPAYVPAHLQLGAIEREVGNMEAAKTHFNEALRLDPDSVSAHYHLASITKTTEEDRPRLQHLEAMSTDTTLTVRAKSSLHFALGRMYHDLKEYEPAFRHYQEGNRVYRTLLNVDRAAYTRFIDGLIATYTPEFFARTAGWGSDSHMPILIVGMPRSGTTLVEQIISSHSQVFGAGELNALNALHRPIAKLIGSPDEPYPNCMEHLTPEIAQSLAQTYLDHLHKRSGGAERVTDKMPANLMNLGLIATLFPRASVIRCMRDYEDNALSIFFQKFATGNEFAFDLADIAFWFQETNRLYAHWKQVLPIPIFEAHYRQMVREPEVQAHALLEFCGLPWEDACLDFQHNTRSVRTASVWQVRQPIYTSSLEGWKRYEPWLGGLWE